MKVSKIDMAKVIAAFERFILEEREGVRMEDIANDSGLPLAQTAIAMHAAANGKRLYRNKLRNNRWEFDLTVLPAVRVICTIGPDGKGRSSKLRAARERRKADRKKKSKGPAFIPPKPNGRIFASSRKQKEFIPGVMRIPGPTPN